MNKEVRIETAKLLSDKKIELFSDKFYTDKFGLCHLGEEGETLHIHCHPMTNEYEVNYDVNGEFEEGQRYYAPTIAEVVMWLYENHGIWISVESAIIFGEWYFNYKYLQFNKSLQYVKDDGFRHNSPIEAYEAAINYCLEHLIK